MVADPLREKMELYRWEIERAERLLANPFLPEEHRPKLERARNFFRAQLRDAEDRLQARETNHGQAREVAEPAVETRKVPEPSRWRRNLVVCASLLMFFVALCDPRAQRAYYQDAETFLGMIIFLPVLAGLFTYLGIAVFDFMLSPGLQRDARHWLAKDPVRSGKEIVRFMAMATFMGCIFLSFFGLEWLLSTWVFWTSAGVAVVMLFFVN